MNLAEQMSIKPPTRLAAPTRIHRLGKDEDELPPKPEPLLAVRKRKSPRTGKAQETRQLVFDAMPDEAKIAAKALAASTGLSHAAVFAHLKALKAERKVMTVGKGHKTAWARCGLIDAIISAPKPPRKAAKKLVLEYTPATSAPKFGYFSDGSFQIDCAECKGILTRSDILALRAFCLQMEPGA